MKQCYLLIYLRTIYRLSGYSGDYVLVAARQTGSDTYTLLAGADHSFLSTLVTSGGNTANHNATEWYNRQDYSFGFAGGGDTVSLSSCDTASSTRHFAFAGILAPMVDIERVLY